MTASFVNSEVTRPADIGGDVTDPIKNLQGINLEGDAKIVKAGEFRLGGVVGFQRVFGRDGLADVDRYSFGPRASYRLGPVEPFAGVQFGLRRFDGSGGNQYSRIWTAGVDVPFTGGSNVALRPFFIEREYSGGFAMNGDTKYGAGVQFRF